MSSASDSLSTKNWAPSGIHLSLYLLRDSATSGIFSFCIVFSLLLLVEQKRRRLVAYPRFQLLAYRLRSSIRDFADDAHCGVTATLPVDIAFGANADHVVLPEADKLLGTSARSVVHLQRGFAADV